MHKSHIPLHSDVGKTDLRCAREGSESLHLLLNKMIVACLELTDRLFSRVFGQGAFKCPCCLSESSGL